MTDDELAMAIQAEYARLGWDWENAPFDVATATTDDVEIVDNASDPFLSHLRSLPVGATWRDVFSEIPAHWDLEDRRTWTVSYHPLGPLDYPALPTGPALLVAWPTEQDDGCLDRLCSRATSAGFRVHAAWPLTLSAPFPDRLAYVVLANDTSSAAFADFQAFVEVDREARIFSITRTGSERYHS